MCAKKFSFILCFLITSMLSAAIEYEWSEGRIISIRETEDGTLLNRLRFHPERTVSNVVSGLVFSTGGLYTDAAGHELDISLHIRSHDHETQYHYCLTETGTGRTLQVHRVSQASSVCPNLPDQAQQDLSYVTYYWNGESVTIDPVPSEAQFFALYGMPTGPGGEFIGGFISRFAGSSLYDLVIGYHAFSHKVPFTCFSMTAFELCPLLFNPGDFPGDPAHVDRCYPVDLSKAIINGEEYILSRDDTAARRRNNGARMPYGSEAKDGFYFDYPHGNPVRDCLDGFIECLDWEAGYYESCFDYCYDTYGESPWRVAFCIWQCDLKESLLYWMCSNRFLHCLSNLFLPPLIP